MSRILGLIESDSAQLAAPVGDRGDDLAVLPQREDKDPCAPRNLLDAMSAGSGGRLYLLVEEVPADYAGPRFRVVSWDPDDEVTVDVALPTSGSAVTQVQ